MISKQNGTNPPWLGLCHNTLTTARTPRQHPNVVMRCTVMWRPFLAVTSSVHNSIHPPEMETNPPKMARGCPCSREKTQKKLTLTILSPYGMNRSVNVQLQTLGGPQSVHLGSDTATRTFLKEWTSELRQPFLTIMYCFRE